MSKDSLAQQNVIVTGGARGIGREYALRFADRGANVAIVDLDLESYTEYDYETEQMTADTVDAEIANRGVESLAFEVDVTDPRAVQRMVESVVDEWGTVDVLVANAGGGDGSMSDTHASELPPEHLRATVERNLYGTVYSCVAVAPHMKTQRSGSIVTVASQAGRTVLGDGTYAHYGAAKAGVIMYTKYLAQDLGRYGITVNAIAPGYIETGKLRSALESGGGSEVVEEQIALGRLGTTTDCAAIVEFLATPAADYVTGCVIPVDGGSTLR